MGDLQGCHEFKILQERKKAFEAARGIEISQNALSTKSSGFSVAEETAAA
jgi:hypothetical protein